MRNSNKVNFRFLQRNYEDLIAYIGSNFDMLDNKLKTMDLQICTFNLYN